MDEQVEVPVVPHNEPLNDTTEIERNVLPIKCSKLEEIKLFNPAEKYKHFYKHYRHQYEKLKIFGPKAKDPVLLMSGNDERVFDCSKEEFNTIKENLAKIRFEKSPIHLWGAFSATPISAGEPIVEYTGELIRRSVEEKRQEFYESQGNNGSYIFRLDDEVCIDATNRGGIARFLNHSCEPNCATKIINADGELHAVIYAKRDIAPYEELTYNYRLPYESKEKAIPCNCGAPHCKLYLNYSEIDDAKNRSLEEQAMTNNTYDQLNYYED